MKVDAHGHLHDDVGRFARSRVSRALEHTKDVNVTHSTLKGERARVAELEAMPEADLRAELARVRPDMTAGAVRVTGRERIPRMIVRAELGAGQLRKEVFTEDELERIEQDRERSATARHNAHAVLAYLNSDRPARSGGATTLPANVRMVRTQDLYERLVSSRDYFVFDRELHRRYHSDSPSGWEHIVDRQLALEGTDDFIDDIVRNGMQPIQISDDNTSVGNGHHRLAMAVLMQIPEIPVSAADLENWDGGASYSVPLR